MADSPRDLFANQNRFERTTVPGVELRPTSARERAVRLLISCQAPAGVWSGIIRSSVRSTAEYVVLLTVLNRIRQADQIENNDPAPHHEFISIPRERICCAAAHIASQQTPAGAWSSSTRAADLDTSILAYLALRLAGHDRQAEHLERARAAILSAGGVVACDPLTKHLFAMLGEIPFPECLPLPPEFGLLPAAIPGATARTHLLTRTILTAASILTAQQPVWSVPESPNILSELDAQGTVLRTKSRSPYRVANLLLGWSPWQVTSPSRKYAARIAESWLIEKIDLENGGVAGDATATIWATVALLAGGRDASDEAVRSCLGFLDSLRLSIDSLTEIGLATADVRGTAIVCRALGVAGVSMVDVPMQRSVDWLLSNESHRSTMKLSPAEMSGWSAPGGKVHAVDTETTALTLLALREQFVETPPSVSSTEDSMVAMVRASSASFARRQIALLDRMAAASRRSRRWLVEMQNPDGGWGRFERGPRRANHKASLWSKDLADGDLSSPIVTSWVLEALARWDLRRGATIENAIAYLRQTQHPDGSWSENDDAQSIVTTWRAVTGLVAADVPTQDAAIASAAAWLISQQLKSGGWCDPAASSRYSRLILEPVSIVHTAWALLTLVEAGVGNSTVADRAVQFLLQHQQSDGGWGSDELASSYRASMDCGMEPYAAVAWPLMAVAAWSRVASA